MIAIYQLRRELWQELYDRLTDGDVEEFNQAFGVPSTKEEVAYMIQTITRIDHVLFGYYGHEIAFRTNFRRVVWGDEYIHIEVEIKYRPFLVWN
jgi:hypothetical protein